MVSVNQSAFANLLGQSAPRLSVGSCPEHGTIFLIPLITSELPVEIFSYLPQL